MSRIADDVVTTAEDHPFWNATDGTWRGPEEFDAGDRVLTADGNLLVTGGLVASSWHTGSAFNLTVDGIHTYYVVVADEAVLVHNCPGGAHSSDGAHNEVSAAIRVAEVDEVRANGTLYIQPGNETARLVRVQPQGGGMNSVVIREADGVTPVTSMVISDANLATRVKDGRWQ